MESFVVDKLDQGKRLDCYLREKLPGLSGKKLKVAISNFNCRVNGKVERFASYKVIAKDQISFDFQRSKESKVQKDAIEILHEDQDTLIIDKPPHFICSQESLEQFFDQKLFLVHRLDKETSGALILAKNQKAKSYFENLFRNRKVYKKYIAISKGRNFESSVTVDGCLKKKSNYDGGVIWQMADTGLSSQTSFKKAAEKNGALIIKCYPLTGRTHQIRVHLSHLGCPIFGDYQYAPKEKFVKSPKRMMLHASLLRLTLPSREKVTIKAKLPKDMADLIQELSIDIDEKSL